MQCGRFDEERKLLQLRAASGATADALVVLREGTVPVGPKSTPLPVLLVSHALGTHNGRRDWPLHPSALGGSDGNTEMDSFMIASPLSSSPREVAAESESEPEDNVATRVERIQGAMAKLVAPQPSAQPSSSNGGAGSGSLDWIFEVGAVNMASSKGSAAVALTLAPTPVTASPQPRQQQPPQLLQLSADATSAKAQAAREKQAQQERDRVERAEREQHKAAFFEKMKHRKAADLVQGIKAFVAQFTETPPQDPGRQQEVVRNFLQVSEDRIRNHALWHNASEGELEEMSEALERFVLSKLYRVIFATKGSDLELDERLQRRIAEVAWLEPRHLDIALDLSHRGTQRVLALAVEQLRGWNAFKAPRDKMVCILNACKAIWKLLSAKKDGKNAGADEFLPHLIYTVIRANPPNLHSNVEYIARFRHPDKMHMEYGYYFTQLASVVPFIERLTAKSLTITEEEFRDNVARTTRGGSAPPAALPPPAQPIPLKTPSPRESLVREPSAVSLFELGATTDVPLPRSSGAPAPLQRISDGAASSSRPAAPREAPPLPPREPSPLPSTSPPSLPPNLFRFVGRTADSLTLAEVRELLKCYEALASK